MLSSSMFVGCALLAAVFLVAFRGAFQSAALERKNYRGKKLPTGAGLLFAPVMLLAYCAFQAMLFRGVDRVASPSLYAGMLSMLVLTLGMCLVGFVDDVAGSGSATGFQGHFRSVLRGEFTTGALKAMMGFVVALAASAPIAFFGYNGTWTAYGIWVLDAAVIALAANLFNLLDLRPGRALKVFFAAELLALGLTVRFFWHSVAALPMQVQLQSRVQPAEAYLVPAICVIAVALVLFPGDLRERHMLGDAGSNVIGAAVGLGLVLGLSFWWRLGALGVLLVLNLISEKVSYTELIARNRVLDRLDSIGRKGQRESGAKYK